MGTVIRPEVSKKKDYYISKERYYELVHFCRQYYEYKKEYTRLMNETNLAICNDEIKVQSDESSVEKTILKAREFADKIAIIEKCCNLATENFTVAKYILQAVTKGTSYEWFRMNTSIYISRNKFYEYYRKFFFLLDKERG